MFVLLKKEAIIYLCSLMLSKSRRTEKKLDEKHKDHSLSGNLGIYRECHIQPDWLLIYEIQDNKLILYLSRTGTHSDLF